MSKEDKRLILYAFIGLILFLLIALLITIAEKDTEETWSQAIQLMENYDENNPDSNYVLYVDGELKDPKTFNLSTLNDADYEISINQEEKQIILTRKRGNYL